MNCCETDLTGSKTRNIVLTRFEAIMEEEVFHFCCPRFTVKKIPRTNVIAIASVSGLVPTTKITATTAESYRDLPH